MFFWLCCSFQCSKLKPHSSQTPTGLTCPTSRLCTCVSAVWGCHDASSGFIMLLKGLEGSPGNQIDPKLPWCFGHGVPSSVSMGSRCLHREGGGSLRRPLSPTSADSGSSSCFLLGQLAWRSSLLASGLNQAARKGHRLGININLVLSEPGASVSAQPPVSG